MTNHHILVVESDVVSILEVTKQSLEKLENLISYYEEICFNRDVEEFVDYMTFAHVEDPDQFDSLVTRTMTPEESEGIKIVQVEELSEVYFVRKNQKSFLQIVNSYSEPIVIAIEDLITDYFDDPEN